MPRKYSRRLSLPMTIGMKDRLDNIIPEGVRSAFLRSTIDISLDAIETSGPKMLGMMLNGVKFIELVPRDIPKI